GVCVEHSSAMFKATQSFFTDAPESEARGEGVVCICNGQHEKCAIIAAKDQEIAAIKSRAEAAERRVRELERLLKAMTELASENDDDAGKAQDERDTARAEAARLATLLREVLGAPKSPTCYLGLMNRIREQLAAHESAMRVV